MALSRSLAQCLLKFTKSSSQNLANGRLSSSSVHPRIPTCHSKTDLATYPGDKGIFRRFLHKQSMFLPELGSPLLGDGVVDQLKAVNIAGNRIRWDGLLPPPENSNMAVTDAKKLLKAAQLEMVKSKLREIQASCIPYSEFLHICTEYCSDEDHAKRTAKMLDDSAAVIVFGNNVFLRPEEVTKAIQRLLPHTTWKSHDEPEAARKELEELEKQKAAIDAKADGLVRRELWGGLGYLVLQTALFMRLTFWELSWDVMEPICFYVTSFYFMAGYAFFLRTSKEPSLEGFYQSRFSAKQKRLMQLHQFDLAKYNELRAAFSQSALRSSISFA